MKGKSLEPEEKPGVFGTATGEYFDAAAKFEVFDAAGLLFAGEIFQGCVLAGTQTTATVPVKKQLIFREGGSISYSYV